MNTCDVLFIHAANFKSAQNYLKLPSLELCQISAVLNEAGYSNKLVDLQVDNIDDSNVGTLLPAISPEIVVLYADANNHINTFKVAYQVSQIYGGAIIGVLGMVVSFIPEYLLMRYRFIDFVLLGNADYVIKNLLDKKCSFKNLNIKNIAFRNSIGQVINNGICDELVLDDLPISNRALYDLSKYKSISPETIVRSSRGCPSKCVFCNKSVFSAFKVFSMEHFFDEIEVLIQGGFEQFFFADDTFAFSKKRLLEFCAMYRSRKCTFKWTSNIRLCDITEDMISMMQSHGAYRVFVGIETLNEAAMNMVNKSHNILDISKKIEILQNRKIEFHASLMVGVPGDTVDDLEATLLFIKKVQPTLATFNRIKLFPGTDMYKNPEKYGFVVEDMFWFENPEWCDRQLIYTKDLTAEQIMEYSLKMMREMLM